MKDERRTKKELIDELAQLRRRVAELEASEIEPRRADGTFRGISELLEKIFSTTHLLIAHMDTDFNFIRVNHAYAAADDREPEFFVGKNHFDLYPHENNKSIFRHVVETGELHTAYAKPFEYVEHPERSVMYWDWTVHPVKDASGKVEGLVLELVNVTERIKIEAELTNHHEHLGVLVEERTHKLKAAKEQLEQEMEERKRAEKALREKTHELSERVKELNCLYHISNLVEKPGISLEEILRGTVDLIPPSWQYPEVTCARIILQGQEFRSENFRESVWKQADDIVAHGERIGSLQVCYLEEKPESDEGPFLKEERSLLKAIVERLGRLTEQMRAEEALRESEEKYRSMMEAMHDPVYICSPDFRVEYMNPAMVQRTGREATGEPCYKAINDLDEKCPWCVHEKIQQGEYAETEIVSPRDGLSYQISHSPIFHVDGSISKMTIFTDITQHKRAEDALRNSERELSIRNRIAKTFLTTYDEETYGKVLEVVLEAMGSKYGTFAYINENGDRVVPSLTRDIWDECQVRDKNIVFPRETWGNNLWAKCLIEKKAISSNGPFRVPDGHIPITRVLAVPIIYQGEAIGNFIVGNKATDYDEADEELLKRIATHTAPILRARLEKDIQHRKRERAEKALLKARDDLEQRVKERTAELQSLSSRLLDVQEDERKRIAGDLHDGIGQSLSTIKFSIESVLDRLEEETDPSTLDTLRSLVSMLQDSIEDVRNTVMNLRPSILDDLGILATISWFFRQFQAVYSGIRVEEQIDVQETEVPDALKTNIFRVLQEATNNIAKHSKADRMRVALGKNEGAVELVIEDNGRGFDPRSVPTAEDGETGFGITSMKERTELSGGSFSIESKKGAGTTVRASWPYRSE